jgi:hypothetical protein
MTPEELQEITTAVAEAWNNLSTASPEESKDYLYVIGSIIPTLILLGRWFKKAFVKAMADAVEKLLKPHTEEIKELKETVNEHATFIDKIRESC